MLFPALRHGWEQGQLLLPADITDSGCSVRRLQALPALPAETSGFLGKRGA